MKNLSAYKNHILPAIIAPVLSVCLTLLSGCAQTAPPPVNIAEPDTISDVSAQTEPIPPDNITEPPETEPPTDCPPITEPPETEPPETELPITEPPITEPPITEPPITEPSVTEPPITEPPITEPPATEPPETAPPVTEPPAVISVDMNTTKAAEPKTAAATPPVTEAPAGDPKLILPNEAEIIAGASVTLTRLPDASGIGVKSGDAAVIDYSNAADGYCMLKYTGSSAERKIVRVTAPTGVTYDYLLTDLTGWNTYPFSEGSGTYAVALYEQRAAGKYTPLLNAEIAVILKDGFTGFLYPNCFVNFNGASSCVKLAAYITEGKTELERVNAVFDYVVDNLSYDYNKASTVTGGYCPDLESTVKTKTGICFDYASLMTAMLRSVGLPAKLVFGYTESVYHAWISVYTSEKGWVDDIIRFNGSEWKLMDPTYASTSERSKSVMERTEDKSKYSQVYVY